MPRSYTTDWTRLTPRWRGEVLTIGYADSRGNSEPVDAPRMPGAVKVTRQRRVGDDWMLFTSHSRGLTPNAFPLMATAVAWPKRARTHLRNLLQANSAPRTDAAGHPRRSPIALLVAGAVGGPLPPDSFFHALMNANGVSSDRYVVVLESDAAPRADFALPFTVAASGAAFEEISNLSDRILSGLTTDERARAVRLHSLDDPALEGPPDIVIDELGNLPTILSDLAGTRLFIAADPDRRASELPRNWLPAGTSAVVLPVGGVPAAQWSSRMLLELIHDLPLQEAVVKATEGTPTVGPDVRIWSSPSGLDALRMTTAYTRFMDETRYLFRYTGISGKPRRPGKASSSPSEHIEDAITLARAASLDFKRESDGLSQLARAGAARERAERAIEEIQAQARARDAAPTVAQTEPRRVTMWLEHDPAGRDPDSWQVELSENTTLARDSSYVLNVGIGIRWDTNLVPEDAPAIDPLLPALQQEKHHLQVAIFSDSSEIVGEAAKVLTLPHHGPSEPITFRIDTPASGNVTRVRVLIYFRSHLLQALTIDAPLEKHEAWTPGRGLKARVQFSRSVAFTDLDSTPERLLSVATNDDLQGPTHSFMFETGQAVRVTEKMTTIARDAFTDFLADAASRLAGQESLASADFDDTVRGLVKSGRDLWNMLFSQSGASTQTALTRVRRTAHGTVQFTRLAPAFSFPWSMMYDWSIPESEADFTGSRVCVGVVDGAPCGCTPQGPGLCVRGFWGIRLIIEELIGEGSNERLPAARGGDAGHPVVCTNGTSDKWSDQIATTLSGAFGDLVEDFPEDASG